MQVLLRWIVGAAALYLTVWLGKQIGIGLSLRDVLSAFIVVMVLTLVNAFVRPIVKLISLPLNLLTFGLIGFVINLAMVLLSAWISESLNLGFTLAGWPGEPLGLDTLVAALLVSIVLSVVVSTTNEAVT